MQPGTARSVWHGLEHLNAVTYFAPECRDAPRSLGLRGFWAGYFANRAAPLGPVPAGVVEATFFNFHPAMVRRAIPDVWGVASPEQLVRSRAEAAAAALRRMLPEVEATATELLPLLLPCIDAADGAGRPLFSANRDLSVDGDPVESLWQACTTLREQRGDGHVAVLTAEGLDGLEAHVLFAACEGVPVELLQASRGWASDDWEQAAGRLVDRRLLERSAAPTERGRTLRGAIESRTDELGARAFAVLDQVRSDRLVEVTGTAARAVAASGLIPYPNPMGLPAPQ